MLYANVIMPPAQLAFIANVEAYAKDCIYETNDCSQTLDQLLATFVAMVGVTNPTCGATQAQIQCFLSLLTQPTC